MPKEEVEGTLSTADLWTYAELESVLELSRVLSAPKRKMSAPIQSLDGSVSRTAMEISDECEYYNENHCYKAWKSNIVLNAVVVVFQIKRYYMPRSCLKVGLPYTVTNKNTCRRRRRHALHNWRIIPNVTTARWKL